MLAMRNLMKWLHTLDSVGNKLYVQYNIVL